MLDKTLLSRVKSATVAIGVMTLKPGKSSEADEPRVGGTGFFVDTTGYVMTANHVAISCHQFIREKGHGGLVAIRLIPLSDGSFRVSTIEIGQTYPIMLGRASDVRASNYSQSLDLDVAVLRPVERQHDTPFLQIKSISQLDIHDTLFEKVAMCGYPSGEKSLNIMGGPLRLTSKPCDAIWQNSRIVAY